MQGSAGGSAEPGTRPGTRIFKSRNPEPTQEPEPLHEQNPEPGRKKSKPDRES